MEEYSHGSLQANRIKLYFSGEGMSYIHGLDNALYAVWYISKSSDVT